MSKTIDGIVFRDFLTILIRGAADKESCPAYIAEKIQLADPAEEIVHVEWPSEANDLDRPQVWWINDWKTSYARHLRIKALSHFERQVHCYASEARQRIAKAIARSTLQPEDMVMSIAAGIVKNRTVVASKALAQFDMAELLKADAELAEFKKANNIK